jgi:hypothetical protein
MILGRNVVRKLSRVLEVTIFKLGGREVSRVVRVLAASFYSAVGQPRTTRLPPSSCGNNIDCEYITCPTCLRRYALPHLAKNPLSDVPPSFVTFAEVIVVAAHQDGHLFGFV